MKRIIITVVSVVFPVFVLLWIILRKLKRFEKHMVNRFRMLSITNECIIKCIGIIIKGGGADDTNDSD